MSEGIQSLKSDTGVAPAPFEVNKNVSPDGMPNPAGNWLQLAASAAQNSAEEDDEEDENDEEDDDSDDGIKFSENAPDLPQISSTLVENKQPNSAPQTISQKRLHWTPDMVGNYCLINIVTLILNCLNHI